MKTQFVRLYSNRKTQSWSQKTNKLYELLGQNNQNTLICDYVTCSQCTRLILELISLLLPSSGLCPCFPHIFFSHLFLFIFCIPPHPPSTICSHTLLPSTEPQALAHVVMSYGSSTEAWELPPVLDANTMSIKQLWHWCHPLFVILPFSLFYSLHSLSHLIHCEWIHLVGLRQVRGSEDRNTKNNMLQGFR